MEMLQEIGFCKGIENYSRVLSGRDPGSAPFTLLDYFPEDFLLFVDESHVTLPQVRGMFAGDRARKEMLVQYGFRLPSAFDNRPLNFDEFYSHINQAVFCQRHAWGFGTWKIRPGGGAGHPAHRAAGPQNHRKAHRRAN